MDAPPHQNNPQQKKKGKGQGRSKIKLEKIENENNLQVSFSKRRGSLFKKASELDTLSGSKTVVIAFSPSQKAYSYGNPDVETVADMFLNHVEGQNHQIEGFNNDPAMSQIGQVVTDMEAQVKTGEREIRERKKMRKKNKGQNGVAPNLDELDYQQLNELKKSVLNYKQNIKAKVQNQIDQPWIEGGNVFSLDSSSYMGDQYNSNNYPNPAICSNDSLAPFPDNYHADPFFSEMTTTDTGYVVPPMNYNMGLPLQNPHVEGGSSGLTTTDTGYVDPFVPPMNYNMGLQFQNPHVEGGSSGLTTTDTGYVDSFVPLMNYNIGHPFQNPHVEGGTFGLTTTDNGYVDPFVPTNDNLGLSFQDPNVAGGSNPNDAQMNTNVGIDDPFFLWDYAEDHTQGFPSSGAGFM